MMRASVIVLFWPQHAGACTTSISSDYWLNFPKRHVLADSGPDCGAQRAIAVERFAVERFAVLDFQ